MSNGGLHVKGADKKIEHSDLQVTKSGLVVCEGPT